MEIFTLAKFHPELLGLNKSKNQTSQNQRLAYIVK